MRCRIFLLTSLFLASALLAEAGERDVRDFRFVKDTSPVLHFSNPATLTGWSGRLSAVTLSGTKGNGAVVPLEGSRDDFSITAGTESYCRLDRIAFHGRLSWSDFQGREMGGPVLMDPDQHPVAFLESDPTTVGTKKRETYMLAGALSLDLGPRWTLGLGCDYAAGDQTKVKDPRFSNVLMDLTCVAGVAFRASDGLLLGLSLHYRDRLEQVRGGVYGTSDIRYFIQMDKGGFLGTVSDLDGDYNYISTQNFRPMADRYYGIALQALVGAHFSNELAVRYRSGFYGKKASSSPVYYEYAGVEADYRGRLQLPAGTGLHRFALDLGFASLGNDENVFRYVTPAGQSTVVDYTGRNHILDRIDLRAVLDYRWYRDVSGARPGMTLGARTGFEARRQTTTLYPRWRKHACTTISLDLFGQKVWTNGAFSLILDLGLSGLAGFGTDKQDGSYASGVSSTLKSFDVYLGRDFEFKTLPRVGASAGFTLARRFAGFEVYAGLSDRFEQLLVAPVYLDGSRRNLACITLGCNF
ncbi:MAG: hypothetical protein K6E35_03245 [Bacteroidales bacterium]|nr:hypothetical protein [Bacteroidales bacterium]